MEEEERLMRLEDQVSKHDERLDRHSKRLHSLEDGFMKDAVEIASMKKEVENIGAKVNQMSSRMERIENNISFGLNSLSKWVKALAVVTVVTFLIVLFRNRELAADIAKAAAPLVGGVVA